MSWFASPASLEEREAACRLLVAVRPPADRDRAAQRYRDLFASGELDPAGLFVARSTTGSVRGAMVVQAMPGALGLVWPPAADRRIARTAIEDALVAASCDWLRAQGVKVGQAFASELDRDSHAPLVRHGFQCIARLTDMRCDLEASAAPDSHLNFARLGPENRAAFAAILLTTFAGSLDCPEVTGSRTDAELLEGYFEADSAHEHWFLVQDRSPRAEGEVDDLKSRSVGVLLLDRGSEAEGFELTYLGIAPIFRGRGFGAELVKFAWDYARSAGARAMHLSVDSRNEPALRLYRARGFQASGVRAVFLAHWPAIS